jgi:hypothetical protein
MATFTSSDELRNAEFVGVDLQDSWFRQSNLRAVRMRGADLTGAEIDGDIDRVRVNGIDIAPLVEAELDRRYPERAALRARDGGSMRSGWAGLEAMWVPTMQRAAALPPGTVDVSVDDEWSFAQTLRHLVFATDVWLGASILGRADAFHPIGMPFSGWRERARSVGIDVDAAPSYEHVLQVRDERAGRVREFLATVSDETLREQRESSVFTGRAPFSVGQCLWIIMNEEWHHHRYAVRDLDAIAARGS